MFKKKLTILITMIN